MLLILSLFLLHSHPPELLSQLSGVRRSAGGQLSSGPSASQLQQLQMQLQLERQQAQAARQQLETARNATRGGGRTNAILNTNSAAANPNPSANHNTNPSPNPGPPESNTQHNAHSSQFLLSRWGYYWGGYFLDQLKLSCFISIRLALSPYELLHDPLMSPTGWANRGCPRRSGKRVRPSGPTGACLWRSCCCQRCFPTRTPRPPPPRTRTTVMAHCGISLTSRPWAVLRSWPWTWHWRTSTSRRWPRLPRRRKRRLKRRQRRKSPQRRPFDDMATPSPQTTIVTGWLLSRSNCQWMTKKTAVLFGFVYFFFLSDCHFSSVAPHSTPCLLRCVHWIKVVRRENVKASKRGGCVRERKITI